MALIILIGYERFVSLTFLYVTRVGYDLGIIAKFIQSSRIMYSLLAKCVRHLTIPDCMGKDTCKLVIQQRNLTYLLKYCSSSFLHLDNKIPNRTLFCNEQKASVDFFMFPRRYKFKKPPKTWVNLFFNNTMFGHFKELYRITVFSKLKEF